MSMSNGKRYDYRTDWEKYVSQPEENRFLSSDEEDLLKICDCIELKSKKLVRALRKTSGGIPVHYADGKIYVLKKGPHTSVEGESGSKKSRTVCRGGVVTSSLNGDSCIVTDPKGEICSDSKILWLLHELGIQVYVVDLRTFDKDGYNPLTYIFEYMKAGKQTKAMSSINKFKEMLKNTHEGADDPYWNGQGGDMIGFAMKNLLIALSQIPDGEQAFNLSSVKSFIRQDREQLKVMFDDIASREQLVNSVTGYNDILQLGADKTYSCIVSSANALLSEFASSDELLQMLSVSTFDIRTFYEKPSVLFLVFPDEHKTYQMLTGYIVDQLYQVLVETYGEKYQNKKEPLCSINFICDEVANLKINDLASKVSASRSRQIDWTLIFQSERQMAEAYKKDWVTIAGNCKHKIYLGSSDYNILRNISEQVGVTNMTRDGRQKSLVTVDDLRKMRKENAYKDALVLTGNHIYCAQLPDYDQFDFLKKTKKEPRKKILETDIKVYTPEDLYSDYFKEKFFFSEQGKSRMMSDMEKEKQMEEEDFYTELKDMVDDFFESLYEDIDGDEED